MLRRIPKKLKTLGIIRFSIIDFLLRTQVFADTLWNHNDCNERKIVIACVREGLLFVAEILQVNVSQFNAGVGHWSQLRMIETPAMDTGPSFSIHINSDRSRFFIVAGSKLRYSSLGHISMVCPRPFTSRKEDRGELSAYVVRLRLAVGLCGLDSCQQPFLWH